MAANLFIFFFYGWGSTASRLQPLRGGILLFTIQFPETLSLTWSFDKTDMQSKYGTNASFAAFAISAMEFFPNLSFPVTILDRHTILNSKF